MHSSTTPPSTSAQPLSMGSEDSFLPKKSPQAEMAAQTTPMRQEGRKALVFVMAKVRPTAKASMLVATARRSRFQPAVGSLWGQDTGSFLRRPPIPERSMLPPIHASSTKASQWSQASMK